MKRLLFPSLALLFIISSCNNDKKITTETKNDDGTTTKQTTSVQSLEKMQETADESQKKMEELKKLTPMNTDQLKAALPTEVNGWAKNDFNASAMGDDSIRVTATTVRIPVIGGHSESVNIEFENDFDLTELRQILREAPGVIVQDDPSQQIYPMPLWAHEKDEVFVGRIRRDETQPNTVNMWIVSDNLRKGAATNAVQIAEYLLEKKLLN